MTTPTSPDSRSQPIALRPRDAASALGLSERTLWAQSAPRGPIPCVRLGGSVLYIVSDLVAFLAAQRTEGKGVSREK